MSFPRHQQPRKANLGLEGSLPRDCVGCVDDLKGGDLVSSGVSLGNSHALQSGAPGRNRVQLVYKYYFTRVHS